jgi:integrase
MKSRISTRLVQSIQPAARAFEIRDTLLKGFILRVQPSGTKTCIIEYARSKRQTIGRTSVVAADQARAMARNFIAEYRLNGTVIPKRQPAAPTLAFFINYEYAPWQLASNRRGYEEIERIRRQLLPTLGKKPLNEISPLLVECWRIQRLESGMKPTTVNRQLASLKAALSRAVTWGFIHEHPLAKMILLKVDTNPKPRYLSEEEESALRQALDDREAANRARRESANELRQMRGYDLRESISTDEYVDHLKPMVLLTINTGLRRGNCSACAGQILILNTGI